MNPLIAIITEIKNLINLRKAKFGRQPRDRPIFTQRNGHKACANSSRIGFWGGVV